LNRIAVIPTTVAAYWFVFGSLGRFFAVGLIPIALTGVLEWWAPRFSAVWEDPAVRPTLVPMLQFYAINLLPSLIIVPFYVAWHRETLLGPSETYVYGLPKLTRGILAYAMFIVTISFFITSLEPLTWIVQNNIPEAEQAPSNFADLIWVFSAFLIVVWLSIRWLFLLVEIAIDILNTYRNRWVLSRGHAFRLLQIGGLVYSPALIFVGVIIIFDELIDPSHVLVSVILSFVFTFLDAVILSAISFAYRDVTGSAPIGSAGVS